MRSPDGLDRTGLTPRLAERFSACYLNDPHSAVASMVVNTTRLVDRAGYSTTKYNSFEYRDVQSYSAYCIR